MASVQNKPVNRTCSPVMDIVPTTGENTRMYKCDECKALLLGADDARAHLWWHDTILLAPKA